MASSSSSQGNALSLPAPRPALQATAPQADTTRLFSAWTALLASPLGRMEDSQHQVRVFTVSDTVWAESGAEVVDGLEPLHEPWLARLVLGTQLVVGQQQGSASLRTVGGRLLEVVQKGKVTRVNGVPARLAVQQGGDQIWILDKLLFIKPEDIEIAVERLKGNSS